MGIIMVLTNFCCPILRLIAVFLVVFAAAGACSPRLRAEARDLENAAEQEFIEAVNMKRSAAQIIPNNDIILSDRPARAGTLKHNKLSQLMMNRLNKAQMGNPDIMARLMSGVPSRRSAPGSAMILDPKEIEASDLAAFNPTPYEEGTPEWNLAMINFLLQLKAQGHRINEIETDKPLEEIHKELAKAKISGAKDPLVCKTAPYNICYRLDENGHLHPIGDRRPVRILRVY